jgi:hypothetical protein
LLTDDDFGNFPANEPQALYRRLSLRSSWHRSILCA